MCIESNPLNTVTQGFHSFIFLIFAGSYLSLMMGHCFVYHGGGVGASTCVKTLNNVGRSSYTVGLAFIKSFVA